MTGRGLGSCLVVGIGLLFAVAGGCVAFLIGKPILDNAKASESWPSVPGRIIESEMERHRNDGKTTYSALIAYEFTVNNQTFEGDGVWFGQYSTSDRSEISNIVRQYPVGQQVDVYYAADDPTNCVLQPGVTTSSYLVFGIGLLFLGIGSLLIIGPVVKGIFLTAAMATAPEDAFAGGGHSTDGDPFGRAPQETADSWDSDDRWGANDQQPRFGDDRGNFSDDTHKSTRPVQWDDTDDDGFHGIPG